MMDPQDVLDGFQTLSTFVASIDQDFTWRVDISDNLDLIFIVRPEDGFESAESLYSLGTLAPNVSYVVEIIVSPGLSVPGAFINGLPAPISSASVGLLLDC